MSGLEELTQRNYLKESSQFRNLNPDNFGNHGILKLGATTFHTLNKFLDIDISEADHFTPKYWVKPSNVGLSKPDDLIVHGRSIIAVIERKSPNVLSGGIERRKGLEQLQTYLLTSKAKLGILTDGKKTIWIHNNDIKRKSEIKIITENGVFCTRDLNPTNLEYVISKLNHITDEVSSPPSVDPGHLARSIWQDVYIATRQDPEKCFQTFVELFMYKLMCDYDLLPNNFRINNLIIDPVQFKSTYGTSQIEYYFNIIRPSIKKTLFVPMNTSLILSGLARQNMDYITTKNIIPTLDTNAGKTSVIDGHAFLIQPVDYNSAFIGILKKLNSLPHITHLEAGFKSRVYEQFLRRDPNTSKVTGKYFTPRNVVKAIVQMADISQLHPDGIICDPACGVGGFITESYLELVRSGISNYKEDSHGRIIIERKFVGLEVLEDVVCLAKANMLLHCIELYSSFSDTGKQNFTQLLGDIFVHCHEDRTLGSLKHPCSEKFDLVMANPPYIVSGTQNVTTKIREAGLTSYYDAGGSGLESRFLNWIINSLKRGGRAFVVLPKSMLARVNNKFKSWIRDKCIIDALIYLPERSFYTTPNPTYILVVTRKQNDDFVQTDPVFCYYIRDIGETRDTQRNPIRNDLIEMVDEFKLFKANKSNYMSTNNFCKVINITSLDPTLRWDIDYLWTPQELSELGVIDTNTLPCDAIIKELESVKQDMISAKQAIGELITSVEKYTSINLGDTHHFKIYRGNRITNQECKDHPGDIPVVSSGRHESSYLGTISESYLHSKGLSIFNGSSHNIMTVGATGAVGAVHMRRETKWFLHDDALAVEVIDGNLVPEYVRYALQHSIDVAKFEYTAKLYAERLKALDIEVPLNSDGNLDRNMQNKIAKAYEEKESVENTLKRLAAHLQSISVEF